MTGNDLAGLLNLSRRPMNQEAMFTNIGIARTDSNGSHQKTGSTFCFSRVALSRQLVSKVVPQVVPNSDLAQ